jgi:hypothetical protein
LGVSGTRAARGFVAIALLGAAAIAVGIIRYAGPVAGDQSPDPAQDPGAPGGVSTGDAPTPQPQTAPGIRLDAKARPDGTFDVTETLVLREPQSWLVLSPPAPSGSAETVRPRAVQVRLTTGGRLLSVDTDTIDSTRDVYLSDIVSRVELRYRLTGATVRSQPSATRRALSLIAPLTAATDETLRTTMAVTGATVRVVLCPELPANRRFCSPDAKPPGYVTGVVSGVAAGEALAQYQLDLPAK